MPESTTDASSRTPLGAVAALLITLGVLCASTLLGHTPAVAAPPRAAGTVVSVEPLPPEQMIAGASRSLRIEYWTADANGAPRLSSAALYLPHRPARTVVSWAHGANGLGDQCAPTVIGRPARESAYFQTLLTSGFAVVATDYIGLGTPGPAAFLDSVGEANAVSDAVRAARRIQSSIGSWIADGHSQGAHATFNTAARGPARVPEIRYLGAAATSFPPQVDALVPALTPTTPPLPIELTGLYVMALRGFAITDPALHIEGHLTPLGTRLFDEIDSQCVTEINSRTKGIPTAALLRSALTDRETRAFQSYLRLPVNGIARPMFLGSGFHDEILPFPTVLPVVAQLRANGVDARFHGYDAGHDDIIDISRADRVAFMRDLAAHAG
ncbi:lipase family protein [Jongsikchunia kroppenstedtii]|uniref:lipase family protein n=1 Tax=Jongsikchunia kroppenstedtii TaxID=1121721 RepID=UPI0003711F24|nr:lipase family protein [Jongsikchunia kroppenstedtii]